MNTLADDLAVLLAEDEEWGTPENPVLLAYEKRRAAAYPTFYLTTEPKMTSLSQDELATRSKQAPYKDKIVICRPTGSQPSPKGELTFGLTAENQIEVGRKVEFDEKGKRAGGVPKFKEVTTKYGFTPSKSGWDVDHVVELQIGGQDVISNLWPLPAGENRSSGAIIKSATVTLPGKQEMTVTKALEKRKTGKKKKTESLWMMVASTRQR
jgi:hypothetical protein